MFYLKNYKFMLIIEEKYADFSTIDLLICR